MKKKATIETIQEPGNFVEIGVDEVFIGRSEACNIVIPEQYVSRLQAKIYLENNCHVLENMGKNPIYVNSKQIGKHILHDDDHFSIGKRDYIFHLKETNSDFHELDFEEKTVIVSSPVIKESLPWVIITSPDGQTRKYDVDMETTFIGRSDEADIRINDTIVSRKHCVIKKCNEEYFIENLSDANPLIFQKKTLKRRRLITGDKINIGSYILSFFSERPEDQRFEDEEIGVFKKAVRLGILVLAPVLLIALITYFLYSQILIPRKVDESLKVASYHLEKGNYRKAHKVLTTLLNTTPPEKESQKMRQFLAEVTVMMAQDFVDKSNYKLAYETLTDFLDTNPSPIESQEAKKLLPEITLLLVQKMMLEEDISDTKNFLFVYLSKYGFGDESKEVWDLLGECYLKSGLQLESMGRKAEALQEFSAIKETSIHYEEAREAIVRLMAKDNEVNYGQQTVRQIIDKANSYYTEEKYLDAYFAYKFVLSLDKTNENARIRIERIKDIILEEGDECFQKKDYGLALLWFGKYIQIDPGNILAKKKISECRQMIKNGKMQDKSEDDWLQRVKKIASERGFQLSASDLEDLKNSR